VPISQLNVQTDSAVIDAVKNVGPAVVTVINNMNAQSAFTPFGLQRVQPTASGSGVIISPEGYIVTNNHVVQDARSLEVIFADGKRASASLVGADQFSDLAVIKVDGPAPGVAQLGNSDALQPGETVIAIGSALGDFKNTVTVGVVSALHRRLDAGDGFALEGLIQTDAAINHGNSGGPLLNLAGQVVGINTAVVRTADQSGDPAEGLGFAIPANTVKSVTQPLITTGRIAHPYLGISFSAITPQVAAEQGLPIDWGIAITQVQPGTPAARAGLRAGDIITAVAGQQIDENTSFVNLLLTHQVGETITLSVWRNGQTLDVSITLAERPASTSG
jgi:2-alkenal reductase